MRACAECATRVCHFGLSATSASRGEIVARVSLPEFLEYINGLTKERRELGGGVLKCGQESRRRSQGISNHASSLPPPPTSHPSTVSSTVLNQRNDRDIIRGAAAGNP